MKPSPYLNLNRIEFVVTYHCTGRCAHCSLGDRLNQPGDCHHIETVTAVDAIKRLAELFPISSVMTFGGEPLLYPDLVCAIHQTAQACGIKERQVITNGYLARTDERIRETAQALHDAGVNQVLLSVDAFHQQTIPLEPVSRFAGAVKQTGTSIRLHPAWVVDREHQNPYNTKTEEILAELGPLGLPVSHGNNIFMAGNAAKNLAEYYPPPCLDLNQACGSMPYTAPLTDIPSLSIEPNGNVTVCNFVIGNLYREDIGKIAARYDPYENAYMRALLTGGAPALLAEAEANGVPVDCSGCYSVCDVCRRLACLTDCR